MSDADPGDRLSNRERGFVDALYGPAHLNATQAARIAGYAAGSYTSLRVQAHRLMHRPRVRIAMAKARRQRDAYYEGLLSGRLPWPDDDDDDDDG